jgi:hypothetical protein
MTKKKRSRKNHNDRQNSTPGSPKHSPHDESYWSSIVNGRHTVPELFVNPLVGGRLTVEALLRSEGTIEFPFHPAFLNAPQLVFFHIAHEDFWFGAGIINGVLAFQRCEYAIQIPLAELTRGGFRQGFVLSWRIDELMVLPGQRSSLNFAAGRAQRIQPRPTPNHLFNLARRESLTPVVEYDSESDFLRRVHSGLSFVQDKINAMQNLDIFWDLQYEGNRIVHRTPKKEKDLLSAFHALLSDQFFVSAIEVIPEMTMGTGRLDFLFLGQIRGKGIHKVCAEFKSAHSADLLRGIETQLPSYLDSQKAMDGTYCVLDFRGEWFSGPDTSDSDLHQELAAAAERGWHHRSHPIKIHHFYLGRPVRR